VPLTDVSARNAQPGARPLKLFDGSGLYLLVSPTGAKGWRFKYRHGGREKLLSFGPYPEVSLKNAREQRDAARRLVAAGTDPSEQRREQRATSASTFELVAREWLQLQQRSLAKRTFIKKVGRLEDFVFPWLGSTPIAQIRPPQLLAVLKRIEARNLNETAHRVRSECGAVFRYAVATGRAERDITPDLRGALAPVITENRPTIVEPARIGELLRAIDGYRGHQPTEFALRLLPLVFVRPGELRLAQWTEIDLANATWRIPAARMKMREQHIVPLASQVVALLRDLHALTGAGRLLFPSVRSADRPISDNTLNAALRRLGFTGDEIVAHGFRSMASTLLNEDGWHPDLIELQLAHAERNEVRSAYNRAQRLSERRMMMQAWADKLDGLRAIRKPTMTSDGLGDPNQDPGAASGSARGRAGANTSWHRQQH
jgi:integrase